jgi:hypothetical protein
VLAPNALDSQTLELRETVAHRADIGLRYCDPHGRAIKSEFEREAGRAEMHPLRQRSMATISSPVVSRFSHRPKQGSTQQNEQAAFHSAALSVRLA